MTLIEHLQDARVGTLKYRDDDGTWREAVPTGTPGPKGAPGDLGPRGAQGPDGLSGGPVPAGGERDDYIRKTATADFAVGWDGTVHAGQVQQNGALRGPWNGTGTWVVTLERRRYLVLFNVTAIGAVGGCWVTLKMDAVDVCHSRVYMNAASVHRAFHTTVATINPSAGSHTFTVHQGTSVTSDANDYGSVVLIPLPRR